MKDDRPALTDDHEPPPPPDFVAFVDPDNDAAWVEFLEEERKTKCGTRRADKIFRYSGFFSEDQ